MIHENTYKVVEFNGAKGLVFIGDKILTLRRDDKVKNFPLCIDLPGGGREENESPFATFQREVKEEFGIDIKEDDIVLSSNHQSFTNPSKESYFIVAKPSDIDEKDILFGDEGIEWLLMKPEEFIHRTDGIEIQQTRVKKYLDEEMSSK